jgi:hypothetical protein
MLFIFIFEIKVLQRQNINNQVLIILLSHIPQQLK